MVEADLADHHAAVEWGAGCTGSPQLLPTDSHRQLQPASMRDSPTALFSLGAHGKSRRTADAGI